MEGLLGNKEMLKMVYSGLEPSPSRSQANLSNHYTSLLKNWMFGLQHLNREIIKLFCTTGDITMYKAYNIKINQTYRHVRLLLR